MQTGNIASTERRIRPWIAALLSFVGWGLGFYYAGRTKQAYVAAALSFAFAIFIGAAAVIYLIVAQSIPAQPARDLTINSVRLTAAAVAAAFAWRTAAKCQTAPKRGGAGLVGYAVVGLAPIIAAVGLALFIRTFIFHPFSIPTAAMEPTIERGALIVASKRAYRSEESSRAPRRGDIAVFMTGKMKREYRIYRLIGLPGDTVAVIDGSVILNGTKLTRTIDHVGAVGVGRDESASASVYREILPNGISYLVADAGPSPLDDFPSQTVPDGAYFLLGDNRDFAADSRNISGIGFVPRGDLIGRVDFIAAPQSDK